jgi:hypothetical protein
MKPFRERNPVVVGAIGLAVLVGAVVTSATRAASRPATRYASRVCASAR